MLLFAFSITVHAATVTWDGGGGLDTNWNTCVNWDPLDTCPGVADVATFNATSSNNATINVNPNVAGIDIQAGYGGVISQNSGITITVGASGFSQAAGTFTGGDSQINIADGSFSLSGGTFTNSSGGLTVERNVTITGGTYSNSGVLTLGSDGVLDDTTMTCSGVMGGTVNISKVSGANLIINSGCTIDLGANPSTSANSSITNDGTILVSAVWTETGGGLYINNGTITHSGTGWNSSGSLNNTSLGSVTYTGTALSFQKNFTQNGTFDLTGKTITFDGTNLVDDSTITCTGALGGLVDINKELGADVVVASGCSIDLGAAPTNHIRGNLINNGTIVIPSGTWMITGRSGGFENYGVLNHSGTDWDSQGGFYNDSTGVINYVGATLSIEESFTQNGTFDLTGKTVTFDNDGVSDDTNFRCGVPIEGNVQVNKSVAAAEFIIASDCTIQGDFTRTQGEILNPSSAYTLSVEGNVDISTSNLSGGSNLTLALSGSGTQTLTLNAGDFDSAIEINKTGGNVALNTAFITAGGSATCDVIEGVLDLNGQSFTCGSTFTVQDGGVLQLEGDEIVTAPTFDSGSTALYDGALISYTLNNWSYHNLEFFNPAGTWTQNSGIDVNGNLTITSGELDSSGNDLNVAGDWVNTGTYTSGLNTVILNGENQSITGSTTFNNLTKNSTTTSSLIFQGGQTQTILGAMNLTGTAGNYLSLRSSINGTPWNIDPRGSRTVSYLAVSDSNNIHATDIDASLNSINSGNNTKWLFAAAGPFTWTNNSGTGDNNWNTATNWFGGVVPDTTDTAVFTGEYNYPALINTSPDIAGLLVLSGYTATITQQNGTTLTIGSASFIQSDGTFIGGDVTSTIDINNNFILNGGSFGATSGNIFISNNLSTTSGLFTHNDGSITLDGNQTASINTGTSQFNNITINRPGVSNTITGDLNIDGTLTITALSNLDGGNINLSGDLATTATDLTGTSTITFDGIGDQLFGAGGSSGSVPGIIINKPGGTLFLQDRIIVYGSSGWRHTLGTVNAGTSTVEFGGSGLMTIDAAAMAFNHVEINKSGALALTIVGTMTINRNLVVTDAAVINGGTIAVAGNVTATDTGGMRGSATILFNGTGNQLLDAAGSYGDLPAIAINKTGGTLTIADRIRVGGMNGWTYTQGTVDAGTSAIEFINDASITISAAGMMFNNLDINKSGIGDVSISGLLDINGNFLIRAANAITGAINLAGNLSSTDSAVGGNATITLDGTSVQNIDLNVTGDLPNGLLTIDKPAGRADLRDAAVFNGAGQGLTVTQGAFNLNGHDITIPGTLLVSASATLALNGDETITTTTTTLAADSIVDYNGNGIYSSLPLGYNYSNLTFSGNGQWTVNSNLTVNNLLNVDRGTLEQTSASITVATGGSVTVGWNGTWLNESTGNIILGGDVTNQGIITLDSSGGTCGHANDITISSSDATQRNWSGGGTYNFYDLSVSNQGGTITTYQSTDNGGNGWTFDASCNNNFIWLGDGAANLWSVGSNWQGGTAPSTSAHTAVFSSLSTNNANIDINVNIGGINMATGYVGTLIQGAANTITLDSIGHMQTSGTFTGSSAEININGPLSFANTTYTATSGTTFLSGDLTIASGTFSHNSGTFELDGTTNATVDLPVSETFFNVSLDKGASRTVLVSAGDRLIVEGALNLVNGQASTGILESRSNVVVATTWDGGNVELELTGASAQSIIVDRSLGGNVTVNKTNPTDTVSIDGANITFLSNLSILSGDVSIGSASPVEVRGDFSIGANGTFTSTADTFSLQGDYTNTLGGSYQHNSGTFEFSSNASKAVDVNTSETFNNLTINKTTFKDLDIAAGDTLITLGTLLLSDGLPNTGTLEARGDVTIGAGLDGGSAALTFSASADQDFSDLGGNGPYGTYTVNKSGGVISLQTAMGLAGAGQDLTISTGELDLNSYSLTVNDTLTVGTSGVLRMDGGETITSTTTTLTAGSTATYDGTGNYTSLPLGNSYQNLTFDGSGSWTPAADLTVNETLTITSGTFEQTTANVTVQTGGSVSVGSSGTWNNESSGNVTLGGDVTNSGTITLDSSGGACGHADDITVSSTNASQRTWSGGGTFNLYDLAVSNQGGTLTTYQSTDSGGNGWTFDANCGSSFIWIGDGAANLWSVGSNWQGGVAPSTAAHTAIFSNLSPNDANIDVVVDIAGIEMTAGYTGTLTQVGANTVTLGSNGYLQAGGTFSGSSADITINNHFDFSGGSYTATSGTTYFARDVDIFGAGFSHSSGTVQFGDPATLGSTITGNHSLHNVLFDTADTGANSWIIDGATTLTVEGLLTLNNSSTGSIGIDGGTIAAQGDIVLDAESFRGSGTILINGVGDQTLTGNGGILPNISIDKPALTTLNLVGNIGAGADWTFNTASGGTITPGLSTVTFTWPGYTESTITGSHGLNNVVFDINDSGSRTWVIDAATTLTVNGLLSLDNTSTGNLNLNGGVLEAKGDIVLDAENFRGTATLLINGAGDQTLTGNGGVLPNITIDKPALTTLNLVGTIGAGADWTFNTLSGGTVTPGTSTVIFRWPGYTGSTITGSHTLNDVLFDTESTGGFSWEIEAATTLTVNGLLTLDNTSTGGTNINTGTLNAQGNVVVGSGSSFSGSATLSFSGNNIQTFNLSGAEDALNLNIDINKPVGQVNLLSALILDQTNQDLDIQSGTFDLNGQNLTVNGVGSTFNVQAGGNLQLQGIETSTSPILNLGSVVTYDGSIAYTGLVLGDNYQNLTFDGPGSWNPTADLSVSGALNITSGTLSQTTTNITVATGGSVTVGAGGNWNNESTGNLILGGDLTNNGTITIDSHGGTCGHSDDIAISSTAPGQVRNWGGTGTFNLFDVAVSDQSGTITAHDSTDNLGNTWTFSALTCGTNIIWDGGGATNNWSEAANWQGDVVPNNSQTAIFNLTSTKNAIIDVNTSVGGILLHADYAPGTLTQPPTITLNIGSLDFTQTGATFIGGNSDISITDDLIITGGIHTATSGLYTTMDDITISGGTFNHNNGTFTVANGGGHRAINTGTAMFNDFEINMTTGWQFNLTGTMDVDGDLTITGVGSIHDGVISVAGNVTTSDLDMDGGSDILFDGTGDQTLSVTDGLGGSGYIPGLAINKAGGTLFIKDTIYINANITYTSGNVDPGSSSIGLGFMGNNSTTTINIAAGNMAFNNLSIEKNNWVQTTGTLVINNDLTIFQAGTVTGGVFAVAGNVESRDATVSGYTSIEMNGAGNQTLSANGGIGAIPSLNVNKASGVLTLQDTVYVDGNITHTLGTVDAGTSTIGLGYQGNNGASSIIASGIAFNDFGISETNGVTITGTLDIDGDLTIDLAGSINSGNIAVAGNVISNDTTVNGSASITLNGTSSQNINTSGGADLPNGDLIIDKTSGTVSLTGSLTLNGTGQGLSLLDGSFQLGGFDLTVPGALTIDTGTFLQLQGDEVVTVPGTPTLNGGSTVVYYGASGSNTYTINDWNYQNLTITGAADVFNLGAPETVAGDLTLQDGIFDLEGSALTVVGAFNNNASLRLMGSEAVSIPVMDVDSGSIIYDGTTTGLLLTAGNNYFNLEFNGVGGGWTQSAPLDVNGDFSITNGTFAMPSQNLNVAGSWSNTGTFNAGLNNTVILDGCDQTIYGSTTFNNITKVAGNCTLTIESTTTQTISGFATLQGSGLATPLNLRALTPGSRANMAFNGVTSFDFLTVQDSDASPSSVALPLDPANSTNQGNTISWFTGAINAVSSLTGEITPNSEIVSSTNSAFSLHILPTIAGSDSGFDRIVMTSPAGYTNTTISGVLVSAAPLTLNPSCLSLVAGEYCSTTVGQVTTINLGAAISASLTPVQINLNTDVPTMTGSASFIFTVDDSTTPTPSQTGVAGDADANPVNSNSLTVDITSIGAAIDSATAEITPNTVSINNTAAPFSFHLLPTIVGGNTGFDQTTITMPAGYTNFNVTSVLINSVAQTAATICPTVTPGEYCTTLAGQDITLNFGAAINTSLTPVQINFTSDTPAITGTATVTYAVDDSTTLANEQTGIAGNADGNATNNNSLDITLDSILAAHSNIVISPEIIIADGASSGEITIRLTTSDGTPVSGKALVISSDRGASDTIVQPIGVTDINGIAQGTISSSIIGSSTITVVNTTDSATLPGRPQAHFTQGQVLTLTKSANKNDVVVGDLITYTIEVKNSTNQAVQQVRIEDAIPDNFKYRAGSTLLNGAPTTNPNGNRLLTFNVGTIAALVDTNGNGEADPGEAGYARYDYQLIVGSGATPGNYINTAIAKDSCQFCNISNSATADVDVVLDPLFDLGTIIGKVFHDKNGDGAQDKDEPGIAGAMVVLDEGTYSVTDSHGRYHFPAVTPGERLLKINLATLPSGTALSQSETQVVSVTPGLLAKANFGTIQNLSIREIGRPGIKGLSLSVTEVPKEMTLIGNAEIQTIIVNGSLVRLPSAKARMFVNEIPSEVLDFSGEQLVHPALFHTDVSQPEEIASWSLSITTPDGKRVRDFDGNNAPPEIIQWDGYDNNNEQLTGGSLYHYQLTVAYLNGDHATSARRLIGADHKSVIELKLSGGSFKTGNFKLSRNATEMLKEAAKTLRKFPREKVVIEGHADSSGNNNINLSLSKKRAEAAHDYLIREEGIPPSRLELRWYGEDKPIASNDSNEGRLLNRRVEMKGLVSDVTRAERRSRFQSTTSASINGSPVRVDSLGRFSLITTDKYILIEMSNKHGRSAHTTLTSPQLDITHPKEGTLVPLFSDENEMPNDSQPLPAHQLIGKTEPGSLIQIGSKKIPTSETGDFEYPLILKHGKKTKQIAIHNPQGFTYITRLEMNVRAQNEDGKPFYIEAPIPELKLNFPPKGSMLKEGNYTLSGTTSPDNIVLINNKTISIEPDGNFTHTLALKQGDNPLHIKAIDPDGFEGTIDHVIGAGQSELFFMAFADGKFSQLNTSGYIQGSGQKSASELYSEGRLAFYLKGKIQGKYLITAALDTGNNEMSNLFDDLDDDGSKALLKNLDPDHYYPVYGDNSTLVYDTQSQGKFYLAIDSETIHAIVGNYKLDLTDNELAAYRRTLHGGLFEFKSLSKTAFGKNDTLIRLFSAQTRQSHVRDELRATGGSLYYLSQRDIIEGSEQVSLIVKDKNTGLTLSRHPQQQNSDYSIKYLGGRLLFTRPISSTEYDKNVINSALIAGNPVYIEVDYEYHVASFEKSASGAHARQSIGDHLSIGATYVTDELSGGSYELQGVDSEVRILKHSRITAEVAESTGSEGEIFTSNDGGLLFTPIASSEQTGQATKLAAEIDIGEFAGKPNRLTAGAYVKELDPGFQASGNSSDQGKQKSGANVMVRVSEKNTLKLRHDQEQSTATTIQPDSASASQQSIAQWQYKADKWSLTGEYHDQQSEDTSGSQLTRNSLAATKITSAITQKLEGSLRHQTTLEGIANDQSTVGLKFNLTENLHLHGSATSGDKGDAGEARISYQSDKAKIYLTERFNDNQSGKTTSSILGGEYPMATIAGADSGKIYSEYQWDNSDAGDKSLSLVGAKQQWKIEDGLKFNLSSEYSDINAQTGTTSRTSVAAGISYMRKGLKMSTRNELRSDRGLERKRQILSSNSIEYNLNPDYIVLGKYRHSVTKNLTKGVDDASFDEHSIGLAYRPTRHDRLNALARYTRLSDMSPLNLNTTTAVTSQMDVISIEWSFQITKKLEWSDKQALRLKTEKSDSYAEFETQTHLSIHRLNYSLPRRLGLGAEYRVLTQKEADDMRSGWLSEVTWEANQHLRLGLGYNFTDFSDNEFSDNDYSTEGWFLRIQGKY